MTAGKPERHFPSEDELRRWTLDTLRRLAEVYRQDAKRLWADIQRLEAAHRTLLRSRPRAADHRLARARQLQSKAEALEERLRLIERWTQEAAGAEPER